MDTPLHGYTVGITADRRAEDQAELLRRRGADVLVGASIGTAYLGDEQALRDVTEELIARPPDLLVANTGVGMRSWFDAAQAWDLADAMIASLRDARVLARGPKAAAQAQLAGLVVQDRAVTERLEELADLLLAEGVAGRRIAVQLHGDETTPLVASLRGAGAEVVEVPIYRWRLPEDTGPAIRLIEAACDGSIDALTFTSAPAVRNLVAIAEDAGLASRLLEVCARDVLVACVGPVCAESAVDAGFTRNVFPAEGRMGRLIAVVVRELVAQELRFRLRGTAVTLRGSLVRIGAEEIILSARERALLRELAARPGRVVSQDDLQRAVWGNVGDSHRLHVTVARLRRRLGPVGQAIEPLRGRGYRLAA